MRRLRIATYFVFDIHFEVCNMLSDLYYLFVPVKFTMYILLQMLSGKKLYSISV